MQKVAKAPKATRQVLYCLKDPEKGHTPILPLTETDPRKSPLYALVREDLEYTGQPEEERAAELATEWMGPGPWPLRFNVEIVNTCGALRPTNMNKKGNITVSHMLMITMRIEKAPTDEGEGGSKRRLYDIIIQYPIHLLSVSISHVWCAVVTKSDDRSVASVPPEVYLPTGIFTDLAPGFGVTWQTIVL